MPAVIPAAAALAAASAVFEALCFLSPAAKAERKKAAGGFLAGAAFVLLFGYMGRQIGTLPPDSIAGYAGITAVISGAVRIAKLILRRVSFEPGGGTDEKTVFQLSAALTVQRCVCTLSVTPIRGAVTWISAAVFAAAVLTGGIVLRAGTPAAGCAARKASYLVTALICAACGISSLINGLL